MRDVVDSPFVPGAGRVPQVWAGRDLELIDARSVGRRREAGVYDRGRAVLGEYGLGKSVLVNRIAQDLAADGHWVAAPVRLPADGDPVPLLAGVLRDLATDRRLDERIGAVADGLLDRIAALELPVVGGGVTLREHDEGASYRDVLRLLLHVARLAHGDGRLLVLRIDEVQNAATPGLSRLLTVLGDALEATTIVEHAGMEREVVLPLIVYLSGLPDFRERAADAGATFARRFKTFDLEHLEEAELRGALIPFTTDGWPVLTDDGPSVVHMAPEAVDLIVDRCLGDPFLFQLAGEAAWNAGTSAVVTGSDAERGWRQIRREVLRYVEGRLGRLSELQMAYLRAAAAIPVERRTSAAIAAALGREGSQSVASTAQSLDRTHRLIRREAGLVRFRAASVEAFLAGSWP